MTPSPRQLAREQRSPGPGPACFHRRLLRVEQAINQAADSVFLIGGQDNKWLRELMQRNVKPGNKLLVLKTNTRSIKGRGLAIRGFVVSIFRRLPIFQRPIGGLRSSCALC